MATLKLGEFSFSIAPRGYLHFSGGNRVLAAYEPPGGYPIFQDLGKEKSTIEWEGALVGENCRADMKELERLKDEAKEIVYAFGEMSSPVVIQNVEWKYRHEKRIEYAITLWKVENPPNEAERAEQEKEEALRRAEVLEEVKIKDPSRALELIKAAPYFIRQGDSLRSIATRIFKNPNYWIYLARFNGLKGDIFPAALRGLNLPISRAEMLLLKEVVTLIEKRMPVKATYDGGGRGRRSE